MTPRFVESIFHASDFSVASERAFAHALALALKLQADLTVLHAGAKGGNETWTRFPSVRRTLERWGMLDPGSPKSAVFEAFSVRVRKIASPTKDPLSAVMDYLDDHPTDLLVLSTEGRGGLPRWIRPSVASRIARESRTMSLFVPHKARGFVAPDSGDITLQKILLPIDSAPSPELAMELAGRASGLGERGDVEIIVLHVTSGSGDGLPAVTFPEHFACEWTWVERSGSVSDEIARAADEYDVELVVMPTAGRDGVLDALRGSVTEQVLRRARCPLLAVPSR